VITVGSFHGGFKHNIIPDEVRLQLTVRADNERTRAMLLDGIRRVAAGVGRTAGLDESLWPEVKPSSESTPVTVNDAGLATRIRDAFVRELGEASLFERTDEGMGAEDFAYFLGTRHRVPGCYFRVGGTAQAAIDEQKAGGARIPSHHSPRFAIEPEPAITAGVQAMTIAVLELLGKP
jgi:hippurate hydrolase